MREALKMMEAGEKIRLRKGRAREAEKEAPWLTIPRNQKCG